MRGRVVFALLALAVLASPGAAFAVQRAQSTSKPFFDSRAQARSQAARSGRTVAAARPSAATTRARAALRSRLGAEGVVNIDPLTGTPRQLLRTDGALSAPRGGARRDIALDFVSANRTALGLDAADLDGLDAQASVPGTHGLTVVHFRQLYRGIPAYDNDLRVAIDRAGRVMSVAGSPRHGLSVASVEPKLSGEQAYAALQRNVGVERNVRVSSVSSGARRETTFANGDFARLVLSAPPTAPSSPTT